MDLSLVIPLLNEEESLPELSAWIHRVMEAHGYSYEVIYVDDGSTDRSWEVILELQKSNPNIHGIRFRRNYGKSAALNEGFAATRGDIIITMDADLQDSPDEIPELRRRILEEDLDLISGWKQKRFDPITKTLPTKLFNWATRKMSGIYLHDFNCGLKAYRSEVTKSIEVYGEMHRYIPVIAKWAGFRKIGEQVVHHQARKYGVTKFGWDRFINGFLDLLSIFFVGKFGKKPMHFFGLWGTIMFTIGFLSSAYIGIDKLYMLSIGEPAIKVTDNPWFFLAITTMILGTQLFLAGFIGELIGRSSADRNHYLVKERV